MKRIITLWLFLALFPSVATTALADKANIFYLNSYENGYTWSDNILKGIREVFAKSGLNYELQIEYMDSKKYPGPEMEANLLAIYKTKLAYFTPNVVIVSDNNAFQFAVAHKNTLFKGVPVVFCGVNDFSPDLLQGHSDITGVAESVDISGNINIALKLHPTRDRIVVITDSSATGRAMTNAIRKEFPGRSRHLRIEFVSMDDRENLINTVRAASPETIFFFIPQYATGNGTFYGIDDIFPAIEKNTRAPIYSFWKFLIGRGIVGGRLASGLLQGETAASMALSVLKGTPASKIPVSYDAQYRLVFDHHQLRKFNIPKAVLPEGAEVINSPLPFYRLNRELFWVLVSSFSILSVVLIFLIINIVMRRRVEENLKDQISFLEIFMETVPIPIYFKDMKGRYQGVNREFGRWFGTTRAEVIGQTDHLFYPEGVPPLTDESDRHLLAESGVLVYQSRIHKHASAPHHVILHKATYKNAKNEICGIVGAILDIDEMKKAQADLQKAEERYRSIFENATKGIFLADLKGNILNVNNAFAQMLGYEGRQDALTNMQSIQQHYASDETQNRIREFIQEGKDVTAMEIEFYNTSGEKRWASINATLVKNKAGVVEHVEGIGEDITKRKLAEIAMQASKDKLQIVLDNVPQLVYWQDESLKFVGGNRSFKLFYGLDATKEVDATYPDIMSGEEDIKTSRELDHSIIQSGRPCFRIKRNITKKKDNQEVCLEISKLLLTDEYGRVTGILGTAEDITRKVNLEKQLFQAQKMEALGTLSGGIAHDFNNILTSIINSTELALEEVPAGAYAASDLKRVLKASARGSDLVNRILAFSRPSREEFQIVNITEIVEETLSLFEATITGNIHLTHEFFCQQCICLADPTQLHQIIMNLCTNSFHAMKRRGGRITITVDATDIDQNQGDLLNLAKGSYCRIAISDDGPGIPGDLLDKIFDPFFTTKEKGVGTGLGLAVVHGILKGHRGGIVARSVPDVDTTFEVYLPRAQNTASPHAPTSASHHTGSETILFVEDDREQRETVPRVLSRLGYKVLVAEDAREALSTFTAKRTKVDLVITDFDMPGENGFVLAARLFNIAPTCPVIIVSGRQKSLSMDRTQNVREVLIKPYNRQRLSQAINRVLHPDTKEIS